MKFLFDLGGIFFDWDPKFFYKSVFDSEYELNFFLDEVCNNEWNLLHDSGLSIADGENEYISKYPKYKDQIRMFFPNHRKMIRGTFQSSIDQLISLKSKNFLCYVLSNWSAESFIGMKDNYPFLNKFDGMIISGEHKMTKPNKNIYELAIKKFNLIPEETVFIDDKIENIEAAELIGFKTIHLTNPLKIKEEIIKFI